MEQLRILWVDDEVENLKPFIMFLTDKGYQVKTATNGADAISMVLEGKFDLILLDEMMPGMDGLSTLREINRINSSLPVVMVTKSEEEGLMEDAIASQISDYLIKPVNPNQIILAIKKIFQADEIRKNKIGEDYAKFSSRLNQALMMEPDWKQWQEIYNEICRWDLTIDASNDPALSQMHFLEKMNCNTEFSNYISRVYKDWLKSDERPVMSFDLISEYLIPELKRDNPVYFVVLDCMRLDQYNALEPFLQELFDIELHLYYSILPTATPYSRNAIFSGLLPVDIARSFPEYWSSTTDLDNSRNRNEHQLLEAHIKDLGYELDKSKYIKIFTVEEGNYVLRKIDSWDSEGLLILVYNFLDLLAHHRSKNQILKETIPDEEALRAFTKHWFLHSTLYDTLLKIAKQNATVIFTTDHGSIRVNRASQVVGDKDTTSTIRYKQGRNLSSNGKNSLLAKDPEEYGLPKRSIIDNFAFAKEDYFFVYPNSFHQYMKQYNGTFQHGGISMEEMILPLAICRSKG
ncbi:MAG: bifunctional response regulator/alkaline phosphatase family protein [Candidatus Cloacimonetes bacterium]|nr:bifunctional response regulator/alkaline phosphatase family protein [Candidatus Cloacimonadota bacterium]